MINDKLLVELSCNYIYRIEELQNKESKLITYLNEMYPNIKIIDLQNPFLNTNLVVMAIQDEISKEVALIFQGSTNLTDWKDDNLNNFLNKNVNQYIDALKYYESLTSNDLHIKYLAGNSLGGGCAQYVALRYPLLEALCINAAPLSNDTFKQVDNIRHLRVSSEMLHRAVMLDKHRFDFGYPGNVIMIKRSLYGSYNYYNNVELAHRGSLLFPYYYLKKQYNIENLEQLKQVVDKQTYLEYLQMLKAPSLSSFISFDLISNNLNVKSEYDLSTLQKNFSLKIKELNTSMLDYTLTNLKLKSTNGFIQINETINTNLKSIIKHSLLHVSKQDEKLFNNIYFLLEKSFQHFYKKILNDLLEINNIIDDNSITNDYYKILDDIKNNEYLLTTLNENFKIIENELNNLNKFNLKKYFNSSLIKTVELASLNYSLDYNEIIFNYIDTTISAGLTKNKAFIDQLETFIFNALKAAKISIKTPFVSSTSLQVEDIDYIIDNYSIKNIIEKALVIFKFDIYEDILSNSLFYQNQVCSCALIEQLQQAIITLDNLKDYLENNEKSTKRIISLINNQKEYIEYIILFNQHNLIINY